jgi:nicotinamide mononucleotide transporter
MLDWIVDHSIEIFGAVSGIIFVYLEIRGNIWLWPLGFVSSAVYIYVFFESKFYADMGLQWYYLVISIYGWYWWLRGESTGEREKGSSEDGGGSIRGVSRLRPGTGLILGLITLLLFVVIRYILINYTDSPVPGWDSLTTSISVVATWMLARKIIEHWILWIIVDIISIGLYIYKGLYPTVVLFTVYSVMAFIGFTEWKRAIRQETQQYEGRT